ncbi:RtcB family protein [Candidatus Woesearchaeota archaeon]|nr:RtcB family protein [Candidatus Woesearchaeota archaeon]
MDLSKFKRVSDVVWELDKSFKQGMLVPARMYATENLLKQMEDTVVDQLTNVACLPGIQQHALCMPDGHSGYGFPIGGVAAFDPEEGGIISPGGIGFDINCLAGESRILDEFGAFQEIKSVQDETVKLRCMQLRSQKEDSAFPFLFLKKRPKCPVYRLRTLGGHEVIATEDHPLWTPDGMVEAGKLDLGSKTAVYAFEGVCREPPNADIIVDEKLISSLPFPLNTSGVLNELRQRGLLPLCRNDARLPYLIKLLAYNMGDGSLIVTGKEHKGMAWFWGKSEDLGDIRADVAKIGYTPSRIYVRKRNHSIDTLYGNISFAHAEHSMKVCSKSFVALLRALGAPLGNKAKQEYPFPRWLVWSPLWHQRLFLSAYFGAEMSTPSTLSNHHSTLYMPVVGMNKVQGVSAESFLTGMQEALARFEVTAMVSAPEVNYRNKHGVISLRQRLEIYGDNENLMRLYGVVGFEYNRRKRWLSLLAAQYVRVKQQVVCARTSIAETVSVAHRCGQSVGSLVTLFEHPWSNERFVKRSAYEERKSSVRIPESFPSFDDFCTVATKDLGRSGMTWDVVIEKQRVEDVEHVYDFTMAHPDHNFVANSFVVSNCGMRLMQTSMPIDEVKAKLRELVDTLFKTVPAGVGAKGFVDVSKQELKNVVTDGVKWCVDNGYGWKDDIKATEENGRISWADPSKVSDRAMERGRMQIGTLGSGNHYLEIQMVLPENIYDAKVAKALGIEPGKIVIMVHCGSRGFGHQIGTDYLKIFDGVMSKYGIKVLDRELACAPFNSKEGQDYFGAMACAANLAFANRQVITHRIREAFSKVFQRAPEDMGLKLVYDVAHNIAKKEKYKIDGKKKELIVHRKGATRSFGPGNPELSGVFEKVGQPVIVGGSMETGSYLCVGTKKAEEETFGSTMHGSGRLMSRTAAKHMVRGDKLQKEMEAKGIYVKSVSMAGLAEEAGLAYKDISEVVETMDRAGISRKVVALKPLGNVKG